MPDSNRVRAALTLCPTVIVSDITQTDTTAYADIVLPALGWSEKDGTVTNSERRISRQRAFRNPPGEAKADWWAIKEVAKKLGFEPQFNYPTAHSIFVEHSQLSGFENDGARCFDISGLSELDSDEFDNLSPIQWPVNKTNPKGCNRLFQDGKFFTANRRAQFISNNASLAVCVEAPDVEGSLMLNTGRLRDHWHTMTRTGLAPSLTGHHDLQMVQVNTIDAQQRQLRDNQLVRLWNDYGDVVATVKVTEDIKPGELFCAIHWNDQFAIKSIVTSAVGPEVDPISGQPELKASEVSLEPFVCRNWVRVASKYSIDKGNFKYWAQTKTKRGYVTLIGSDDAIDWRQWSESQLNPDVRFTQYSDEASGAQIILAAQVNSIDLLVYRNKLAEGLPSFSWLSSAFDVNNVQALTDLLRSENGEQDQQICSCFGVTKKTIENKVEQGVATLDELGMSLGCGSKCGSCRPELMEIIRGLSPVI